MREASNPPAIELIAAERKRQIDEEGWTVEHDDWQADGQIANAAACYAMSEGIRLRMIWGATLRWRVWPWDEKFWKPTPKDRVRELVKAGALIAAEIERLQRKCGPIDPGPQRQPASVNQIVAQQKSVVSELDSISTPPPASPQLTD